jgi:hypothetical protein
MLLLDGTHMTIPGALMHRATFPATVLPITVPGAAGSIVVGPRYEEAREAYVEAALALRAQGAHAITSNCGFAIAYQDNVAAATGLPTALSSLLLLPMLARIHGEGLGVMTYDATQLDDARKTAAGWPGGLDLPTMDVQASKVWRDLGADHRPALDIETMRADLLAVTTRFVGENKLTALLIECTGFSPFRPEIERVTGLPAFDIVRLVRFLLEGRG